MEIDQLLTFAVEQGASDLHLSVGNTPMIRLHGSLKKLNMGVMTQEAMDTYGSRVMNSRMKQVFEEKYEVDFSYKLEGVARFRVNFFQQILGTSAVFRTIPDSLKSLDELGLPSKVLTELALKDRGLVLLTGPTGSGKSTTLAAMVDIINDAYEKHVITIEDPIEFFHTSRNCMINQREVGANTHSFASALRVALREDPDVILVGEMRDLETVQLALTAAETGHLVLATLHTSSATKTIDRIIDIFPSAQKQQVRSMLSESLEAVVAQRLLPTKDGKGRVVVTEVMVATTAVRNLIREDKIFQIPNVIQSGSKSGMHTLDGDLLRLVREGKVDRQEAIQIAENPKVFDLELGDHYV
ncbi:MAG: type IV pilus twitching motility protein PilT [Candidatus Delongbacteria bacterium]